VGYPADLGLELAEPFGTKKTSSAHGGSSQNMEMMYI
jgi:hypothetical protein